MAQLLLMRHAKSDWAADTGIDFDRPLNQRGVRSARLMGRLLTGLGLRPDLVLSSPAVRAITTARLASEAGGWDCPLREEPAFYEGPFDQVSEIVRSMDDGVRMMAVGHQPTWALLAESLSGDAVDMRTGTVAVIHRSPGGRHDDESWGRLDQVIQPRAHFGSEWDR